MKTEIKKTSFDKDFRNAVLNLLKDAQKEVVIVTGEWSAFDYPELRNEVKNARERGVQVKVYSTRMPAHRIAIGLKYGCEIYEGKEEVWPHFVIADKRAGIISEKHPPEKTGERQGTYFKNSPMPLKGKVALFKKLIKSARKAQIHDYKDPLLEIIEKPLDFGVATDSSRADEVIYA